MGWMHTMNTPKKNNVERYLPYMATVWFFVVLNSYLIWNPLAPVMHVLPAILIAVGTSAISKKLNSTKNAHTLIFCMSVYFLWVLMLLSDNFATVVRRFVDFMPFICIILWPKELIVKTYRIIRKVVVFFAIGSAILSILILLGFGERLPHIVLPAREALHEKVGIVYNLYVFFIANVHPTIGISCRACGMLQEPGHFAILLGYIYVIERLGYNKINYWIIICGLLTFSSAFLLIMAFSELYQFFSLQNIKKILYISTILFFSVIVIYNYLPSSVQEQITFFAYGRNLESVVEAFKETASLTGALDERASDHAIALYNKLSTTQYLFGGGNKEAGEMLSDFRGMILHIGLLGLLLSILSYIVLLKGVPMKLKIALGGAYFLVAIHRAWILYLPYLFFLAYLAVVLYRMNNRVSYAVKLQNSKKAVVKRL